MRSHQHTRSAHSLYSRTAHTILAHIENSSILYYNFFSCFCAHPIQIKVNNNVQNAITPIEVRSSLVCMCASQFVPISVFSPAYSVFVIIISGWFKALRLCYEEKRDKSQKTDHGTNIHTHTAQAQAQYHRLKLNQNTNEYQWLINYNYCRMHCAPCMDTQRKSEGGNRDPHKYSTYKSVELFWNKCETCGVHEI